MPDWTATDILTGALPTKPYVPTEESMRRMREAMADPETVSLVVMGKNGQKVEHRINSHPRTVLELSQDWEQEDRPEERWYSDRSEMWAPRWKRTTWSVTQHIHYRPDDFQGLGR